MILYESPDIWFVFDVYKEYSITTVFVDTRLSKTKHPRKRFQNFRQSCMLSTSLLFDLNYKFIIGSFAFIPG